MKILNEFSILINTAWTGADVKSAVSIPILDDNTSLHATVLLSADLYIEPEVLISANNTSDVGFCPVVVNVGSQFLASSTELDSEVFYQSFQHYSVTGSRFTCPFRRELYTNVEMSAGFGFIYRDTSIHYNVNSTAATVQNGKIRGVVKCQRVILSDKEALALFL
jgi:hypothetical protein